jgi:hypothetical protein
MMKHIREHETLYRSLLMLAKIWAFFGLTGCTPFFPDSGKNAVKNDHLQVLFIGNSYSFDVPKSFQEIASKNGKHVKIASSTYGGWNLAQHREHEPTLKKLRSKKWDLVVIQDFSLNAAYPESRRVKEMYPAVLFFANEAKAIGARPMLYQTWGRRDGQPGLRGDDFYQMNARIRDGYSRAADYAGGVEIAPVGDAWEREFRKGNGKKLFIEDGSHPSDYGNRVSAVVFYEKIFGCEAGFTK